MQASSHRAHLIHIGYVDAPRGAHMQNAVRGLRSARRGAGGRFGRREHCRGCPEAGEGSARDLLKVEPKATQSLPNQRAQQARMLHDAAMSCPTQARVGGRQRKRHRHRKKHVCARTPQSCKACMSSLRQKYIRRCAHEHANSNLCHLPMLGKL